MDLAVDHDVACVVSAAIGPRVRWVAGALVPLLGLRMVPTSQARQLAVEDVRRRRARVMMQEFPGSHRIRATQACFTLAWLACASPPSAGTLGSVLHGPECALREPEPKITNYENSSSRRDPYWQPRAATQIRGGINKNSTRTSSLYL